VFKIIDHFLEETESNLENCTVFCTDGVQFMSEGNAGLVGVVRKKAPHVIWTLLYA
jgi:hypothetical protein